MNQLAEVVRLPGWKAWAPAALLLFLLALVAAIYWPGLSGGFLFDDFANLPALGRYGGVDSWQTLLYYLTSGIADPTGRPVAMASFLLDARDWPADPWPFKRTGLLVHLANGVMLYSVLVALGQRVSTDTYRIRAAALLAVAFWLLAPLWVSTVLYVIQRQATLAAFFVLAGIRLWVASRNAFEQDRTKTGLALAILAVPVMGLLAGLSKANGFLLPLLIAALELTVLRWPAGRQLRLAGWRATGLRWALIWGPTILLLAWLLVKGVSMGLDATGGRPWTLGQRLLSQPRALMEYLYQLWVPGVSARGIFADGFVVSEGALQPWSTVPAMVMLATLLVSGFALRKRRPVLAAAILFFFAGHLLESSVVMLELYFEHRNYLPAALLFWPLAWWVSDGGAYARWKRVGAIGYLGIMLMATAAQARLWSDQDELARVWAQQNPTSARAQTYAALRQLASGHIQFAEQHLERHMAAQPHEPQYALTLLDLRCRAARVHADDVTRTAQALAAGEGLGQDVVYHWLVGVLRPGSQSACAQLPIDSLHIFLEAASGDARQSRSSVTEVASRELHLRGYLSLQQNDCQAALNSLNRRIEVQARPEYVQTEVGVMATQCGVDWGLQHLRHYLQLGAPVARAGSPVLRLRDRLMHDFWAEYWSELEQVLQRDSSQPTGR